MSVIAGGELLDSPNRARRLREPLLVTLCVAVHFAIALILTKYVAAGERAPATYPIILGACLPLAWPLPLAASFISAGIVYTWVEWVELVSHFPNDCEPFYTSVPIAGARLVAAIFSLASMAAAMRSRA